MTDDIKIGPFKFGKGNILVSRVGKELKPIFYKINGWIIPEQNIRRPPGKEVIIQTTVYKIGSPKINRNFYSNFIEECNWPTEEELKLFKLLDID